MNYKLLILAINCAIANSGELKVAKSTEAEIRHDLESIHGVSGFVDKLPEWFTRPLGNIKLYEASHSDIKGTIDSVVAFHTFPLYIDRFKDRFPSKYIYKGFKTFSTPAIVRFVDNTLNTVTFKTVAFEISIDNKRGNLVHRTATTSSINSDAEKRKNEMYEDRYYINGLLLEVIHKLKKNGAKDPVCYQHNLKELCDNSSEYLEKYRAKNPRLGYRGSIYRTRDPRYLAGISNFGSVIFEVTE